MIELIINFNEYRQYLVKKESAEATIRSYQNTISQLNDFANENGFNEISFELMLDYKHYLQEQYKDSTVNNKIVALNVYFNFRESIYPEFRAAEVKLKRLKVQDDNEREYLTDSEVRAILKCCTHDEVKLLIALIARSGLRISEALSLTLNSIKPVKIRIRNKGKSRIIGIPEILKEELRNYFSDVGPDEPMFGHCQTWYRGKMKETAVLAGIEKERVYPHAFRHSYAKWFLEAYGGDRALPKLQRIMGHSKIETTMVYLQFSNKQIAEIMMT